MTQTYSGGRPVVREAYHNNGVSSASVNILLSSIRDSTWKQYDSCLKKWLYFCATKGLDPLKIAVPTLLEFLTLWYEEAASYGTLNSARSSIALVASPVWQKILGYADFLGVSTT